MGNVLTKEATIGNLKRLCGDSPSDYVSVEEMLKNAGRPGDTSKNRDWLYSKLSAMRFHDLFVKEYVVRKHVRWLNGIRLTTKGRRALEAAAPVSAESAPGAQGRSERKIDIDTVLADIEQLRSMYPHFVITFDMALKQKGGDM